MPEAYPIAVTPKNISPPPPPPQNWKNTLKSAVQAPQQAEIIVQAAFVSGESAHESEAGYNNFELTATSVCQTLLNNHPIIKSNHKPLSEWRGSITTFCGFTRTVPDKELKDARWEEVSRMLCPVKPHILFDKNQGQYAVPCLLKVAPLIGNTLEIAKMKGASTIGKMRSKDHVTDASMLMTDIDGVSESDLMSCLDQLKAEGLTFVAYTTHSHGNPQKPGMRVRLIIPLDRAVTMEEYTAASYGFDQNYFSGQVGNADSSCAKMYQQQGTWCCHPSRITQAKSWFHNSGVASSEVLIQLGRLIHPPVISPTAAETDRVNDETSSPTVPITKIIALMVWLDPDFTYLKWLRVIMAVFHATQGSQEGLDLVDTWSSGGKKYKGYRDVLKTWKSLRLNIPNPVTYRTLIMMARDAGANIAAIMQDDAFEVIESEEGDSDDSDLPVTHESSAESVQNPLMSMQKMFGLLNISGKLCIFDRSALDARTEQNTARKLILSSRFDGTLLIERALRAEYPKADASQIVKEFFVHPQTACFMGVEFNPIGTSKNYLNLWEGPTVTSQEGLWLLIQDFLFNIICDGDWDCYRYLIFYIAHALQRPEEKPGVMIILIGGQGVGKGTLGRIFQKIWSATYIQVNNIDAVIGTFNAVLERAYIVFMDEALFFGNRRGTDELKSIVTEPIIQISEKYQPSRQIRSCHRFIAATNADHFKNTERDDRRDFTLRVSEARKGDLDYWKALNDEIENGGVEAMVHDLLEMDLSEFSVRNKPNTRELVEQKLHSLNPIQRWWHDALYSGELANSNTWPDFISTLDAINGVLEVNGGKMHKKPSAITISQAMHKMCPSAKSHQMQSNLGRHRGYLLPSLKQGRTEFEQYIDGVVEWPEIELSEVPVTHEPLVGDSYSCVPEF